MRFITTLLVCLSLFINVPATAKTSDTKKAISKQQAAQRAKQAYPGKVLKIQDKRKHYKVRVLQRQGKIRDVKVDKKNGKIIKKD